MSSDDHFLEKVQFSDEATFHISGAVNCHNVRIWGSENPHAYVGHKCCSPKVSVFCAISSQKVYGPFFFAEETVTGVIYLEMLQLWLMPHLQNILIFIFQQDGSLQYLNIVLPGRWIGHAWACIWKWPTTGGPLRSPDITSCDFFLGDMSKTGYSSYHCHMTSLT